jgi:hypothetical protein
MAVHKYIGIIYAAFPAVFQIFFLTDLSKAGVAGSVFQYKQVQEEIHAAAAKNQS